MQLWVRAKLKKYKCSLMFWNEIGKVLFNQLLLGTQCSNAFLFQWHGYTMAPANVSDAERQRDFPFKSNRFAVLIVFGLSYLAASRRLLCPLIVGPIVVQRLRRFVLAFPFFYRINNYNLDSQIDTFRPRGRVTNRQHQTHAVWCRAALKIASRYMLTSASRLHS